MNNENRKMNNNVNINHDKLNKRNQIKKTNHNNSQNCNTFDNTYEINR